MASTDAATLRKAKDIQQTMRTARRRADGYQFRILVYCYDFLVIQSAALNL